MKIPLNLTDKGTGKPVLVLHGGGGPDSVANIVDHFAADSRVLAPTHPGWPGGTDRPEWLASVPDLAGIYLDLLDGLDDVLVIGSSFGGWVASELTCQDAGKHIGKLILLDSIGPRISGHEIRVPTGGPAAGAMNALRAYGSTLNDPTLLDRLAEVSVPTLVIWGENDQVVPAEFGRAYAAAFPNGRFELIAGAGHVPTRDAPDATFPVIDEFRK